MKAITSILAAAAILFATPAKAEEDAQGSWSRLIEKSWVLREIRGKETGKFFFCTLETTYTATTDQARRSMRAQSMQLAFLYSGDGRMGVSLTSDDWATVNNRQYEMRFRFAQGANYTINAVGMQSGGVLGMFMPKAEWLRLMMVEHAVVIEINGQSLGSLRLTKSAVAIKELTKCGVAGREEEGVSIDDTFPSSVADQLKGTF